MTGVDGACSKRKLPSTDAAFRLVHLKNRPWFSKRTLQASDAEPNRVPSAPAACLSRP